METLQTFVLLFLSILMVTLTFSFVFAIFRGAPFVPSSQSKMLRILKLARLKKGDKVVDLGSGDGRFVIAAARQGAQAVGVELNWILIFWSRLRICLVGLSHSARIVRCSVFDYELRGVDVVICYLSPQMNKKLQAKLLRELKPGARVLTNTFSFGGWEASVEQDGIFLYVL